LQILQVPAQKSAAKKHRQVPALQHPHAAAPEFFCARVARVPADEAQTGRTGASCFSPTGKIAFAFLASFV
jgi:hypothetical protein